MSTQTKEAKEMEFRPECAEFPEMDDAELKALADDIKANGQKEQIILHPDGKILDGRNRYRACLLAEVDPQFTKWDGKGTETEYVISINTIRRHLNAGQRACLAVKLVNVSKLSATKRAELAEKFSVSEGYLDGARLLKKKNMIAEVISGAKSFQSAVKEAKGPQAPEPISPLVLKDRVVAMLQKSPDARKAFNKLHPGTDFEEFFIELFGIAEEDEEAAAA